MLHFLFKISSFLYLILIVDIMTLYALADVTSFIVTSLLRWRVIDICTDFIVHLYCDIARFTFQINGLISWL